MLILIAESSNMNWTSIFQLLKIYKYIYLRLIDCNDISIERSEGLATVVHLEYTVLRMLKVSSNGMCGISTII
jgi:hypothetical protein